MSKYFYSAEKNAFYPAELKGDYERSGAWPSDCVEVEDSVYEEFTGLPPTGKTRGASEGMPSWADIPPRSQEELLFDAQVLKSSLRSSADAAITPLQYAADLDDATEEETALLKKWKQYVVALNRLDLSTVPDIEWPESP